MFRLLSLDLLGVRAATTLASVCRLVHAAIRVDSAAGTAIVLAALNRKRKRDRRFRYLAAAERRCGSVGEMW